MFVIKNFMVVIHCVVKFSTVGVCHMLICLKTKNYLIFAQSLD